jgi:hypothetical protein
VPYQPRVIRTVEPDGQEHLTICGVTTDLDGTIVGLSDPLHASARSIEALHEQMIAQRLALTLPILDAAKVLEELRANPTNSMLVSSGRA